MKKLFTLVVILMSLTVNVFGRAVFFQNPTVEFPSGSEPEIRDNHKYYQQDVLWVWEDGGEVINLHNDQDRDFIWSVDVTGDLSIANGHYLTKSDTHYELQSSEIYFDGESGTITITATNPDFQGVAYSCSYTIIYHVQASSKMWDFNSQQFNANNFSWEERHMSSNNNSPVYHQLNFQLNNTDGQVFSTNATGLLFTAAEGRFGANNPDGNTPVANRYLCLSHGASFTIPHSYFSGYNNPRVRIKMSRFGSNGIKLNITNAKDALGKQITSAYEIGGSVWWGDKGDNNYRGEYHFFITNRSQDFTVKVQDDQWNNWLMLLTVEVYDSPEIKTENDVLGSCYQYLNWEGGTAAEGDFYLHFRGKAEQSKVDANSISTTGNVTCNSTNLSDMGGSSSEKHHYKSTVGEYGTFRFRLDCYTHDGQYVTDYAWRTHSVGYMQKRSYPYTWDFTDVKTYYDDGMLAEDNYTASAADVYSYNNNYNPVARKLWGKDDNGNYGLQLAADGAHDVHYCGGSQLWYGNTIIPELQYLAFTPVNFDKAYNNAMTITDDGLKFDQDLRSWWLWRIMIPEVPNNAVIYVRAHQDRTGDFYNVGYFHGDATNKTVKKGFNEGGACVVGVANDNSGDVIYAIPAPSETTNVTLFFQGVTVRKISVSVDSKTVNVKGYASESRDHDIDASLTAYLTGKAMKSYLVSNPDYKKRTLTLTDVSNTERYVIPAETGYVLFNSTDEDVVEILNGGFHLFVPDMHDDEESEGKFADVETNNGFMVPVLEERTGTNKLMSFSSDETKTNYVLSYKWYDLKPDGSTTGQQHMGDEMFYRVSREGINLRANSAYLVLNTESLGLNTSQGSVQGSTQSAKFTFIFADDLFGQSPGITTGIDDASQLIDNDAEWYNLSGQKLNGMPTTKGLYIVNGKKVLVK